MEPTTPGTTPNPNLNTQPAIAPIAPPTTTKRKLPLWALIALIAGGVLVLCGICGTCGLTIGLLGTPTSGTTAQQPATQTHATQPTSFPTAVPTQIKTPTPKPTATPKANLTDYRALVVTESAIISADFTEAGDACGSGPNQTLSGCRAAMVQAQQDVVAFQKGLDQHPAPSCLTSADKSIRAGLADYYQGTALAIKGIDDLDSNEITQGAALLNTGNDTFANAAGQVSAATC